MARKRINFGLIFAMGAAGLYLFKLYKQRQAALMLTQQGGNSISAAINETASTVASH